MSLNPNNNPKRSVLSPGDKCDLSNISKPVMMVQKLELIDWHVYYWYSVKIDN